MAPRRGKRKGLIVDGILLVDKPKDWTSHDVVGFIRGRYRLAKVGHGGTLDPMATGLLVILLGKGTKSSDAVMQGKKVYEGTYTLGSTTNTQDAEGQIEESRPLPEGLNRETLDALLPPFTGDILQTPPMVSAIKKDGVPLYKLARKGEVIEREPRPVTIYSYEIIDVRLPEVDVRIVCSKGTYVRTLAHDFGQALGCGAHLSALRRTSSGTFSVSDAIEVEALRDLDLESLKPRILPVKVPLPRTESSTSTPVLTESLDAVPSPTSPLVLAIGAFDGLHLGHRAVLETASATASERNARLGILRFHPHPSRILYPEKAPPLLCSEARIQELLQELGVHIHLRLPFSKELAQQEPEAFLEVLFTSLPGLQGVIVGSNWRFGYQGRGDVDLLREAAQARDITVRIAEDTHWKDERISSTRIRKALLSGDIPSANGMLGRPFRLRGTVGHGRKFGRELGFPTANFLIDTHMLLPPPGVYAMKAHIQSGSYNGAGYITHDPGMVEVHLLDFEGDLYDQEVAVDLIAYQRPATPLSESQVLRERIAQDVQDIRRLLTP
ncbi:MAG: tRNA pseudouridine(55) synthase TruB [Kiritimatiellae bacterium]|jgi:tRNA pseudouridine55 synthase|nr:tRNA pseudouridine(55) synthase TruB [Kiritimatiellia bacterium]